jgi:1-deoxy-D-xylulose-5-phosphate reductoisomerase
VQKNIAILGSTGSIGTSSLDVISNFPDQFRVTYLTVNNNVDSLEEQIARFRPKGVVVLDPEAAARCRKNINGTTKVLTGPEALEDIVQGSDVDIVISSLVGFAGLKPTIQALKARKRVALANKETLVAAGDLMMKLCRTHGAELIPVDSEHSAIFQCLVGESRDRIAKIILTASGGPFQNSTPEEMQNITVAQALCHPNWKMGNKITIDSATLMNKGLEVIEAQWLFGVSAKRIEVVIHPQSIIHSMVEFVDGSVKAQLGIPDMKIPIQYALTYPDRILSAFGRVDFPKLHQMTFFEPDVKKFRCLQLAFDALESGGTMPAAMNAANEIAVAAFLQGLIGFGQIPDVIEQTMEQHILSNEITLENVIEADRWARVAALETCKVSNK